MCGIFNLLLYTYFMRYLIIASLCLFSCLTAEVKMAIDIGSGKIKMQVASMQAESPLLCKLVPILNAGTPTLTDDEKISIELRETILAHLLNLKAEANNFHPSKSQAVATELFRKAVNGKETAEYLEKESGIPIRIISQEEEGILGFISVTEEAHLDPEKVVVWDIGSGSFQITCKTLDKFVVHKSPAAQYDLIESLKNIDPLIKDKLNQNKSAIRAIGRHPRCLLENKKKYSLDDVKEALKNLHAQDQNFDELVVIQNVMQALCIHEVIYIGTAAGNTTALLITE